MRSCSLIVMILLFVSLSCKDKTVSGDGEDKVYLTPQEMIPDMMRGINLGNTLEPPEEGGWNNGPVQEYYFDDYKVAGFSTVRVPVRWDEHTGKTPPYAVDEDWMDRVEQVVDWGLERDFFIILNTHHEEWIKEDFSQENKARFDSIWVQISERFSDKSSKLLFEMINEPFGLNKIQVDELNYKTLRTIRKTNPTRVVIYSGRDYTGLDFMIEAEILQDDYLMAYFHSYGPWSFAGQGQGTWGTPSDIASIKSEFERAANWSMLNNIPVMVSEFGAVNSTDYNSRMHHYFTYVEASIENGIAFQAWDDGGQFGIYNRDARVWPEIKDMLIYTFPDSPTGMRSSRSGGSSITVSWENRTELTHKLLVQRRLPNTVFRTITELDQGTITYTDTDIISDQAYDYRIIADVEEGTDRYSYPVRVD